MPPQLAVGVGRACCWQAGQLGSTAAMLWQRWRREHHGSHSAAAPRRDFRRCTVGSRVHSPQSITTSTLVSGKPHVAASADGTYVENRTANQQDDGQCRHAVGILVGLRAREREVADEHVDDKHGVERGAAAKAAQQVPVPLFRWRGSC